MLRRSAAALALAVLAAHAAAQDAIPPETVAAVKRATVFIVVKGKDARGKEWGASGSGFVVGSAKDALLVATNHHVISTLDNDKKRLRLTPAELDRSLKQVSITVVFDSGTRTEQAVKAEPLAADPDNDLAVLRVTGVKDRPTPIDYTSLPKLVETMPVYTFGFPFGSALSTSSASPAITVGKAAVSSLRLDDDGNLAIVQIDGAINPGNSGGPVVDAKGRLAGVAVARIKDGQGIGFAVPAAELGKVMKGRLGEIQATVVRAAAGKVTVAAEAEVLDPTGAVRGVTLHYAVLPKGTKLPRGSTVAKQPGAKTAKLSVSGVLATAELTLDAAAGDLYVQAVPDGGLGADGATRVRFLSASAPGPVAGNPGAGPGPATPPPGAKPPPGWKEYMPKDRTFSVWVPEKPAREGGREITRTISGKRLKVNVYLAELADGTAFRAEVLVLPREFATINKADLYALTRDALSKEIGGRITAAVPVKLADIGGAEYRIEAGDVVTRARVLAFGANLYIVSATGTDAQVRAAAADTFLSSYRLPNRLVPPPPSPPPVAFNPPPSTPGPSQPQPQPTTPTTPPGRRSKIQGGPFDKEFADEGPPGALLVGLDVGHGNWLGHAVIHTIRPVYLANGVEAVGAWHGPTEGKTIVRVVAKPGYAVGGVTVKHGIGMNGLSLTFMKVAGGRLDPADSYECPWQGGQGGGQPVKILTDGRLVVGLVGKTRPDTLSGLGLLYPDQSAPPPAVTTTPSPAPVVAGPAPATTPAPVLPPRPSATPQPSPAPASPAVTAEDPDPPDEAPKRRSRLPLILAGTGAGVGLLVAVAGGIVLISRSSDDGARERKNRRGRDRYEDYDDDNYRRRRGRTSRR